MKFTIALQLALLLVCSTPICASPPPLELPPGSVQRRSLPVNSNILHNAAHLLPRVPDDSAGPFSAAEEGGHGGRRTLRTTPAQRRTYRIAHGTIMAVAFAVGFPMGAIFLRTLPRPWHVYVHIGTQVFSTCLAFTGLGLGVWLGLNTRYLDYAHTIIGMAVVASLVIQPVLGVIHHSIYKKKQMPTWWGFAHRWFGRVILIVGIVNGGLGLLLAENTRAGEIVYGAVAGVVGLVWLVVVVLWLRQLKKVGYQAAKTEPS
ncbi:hypothetical protein DRE_00210 [Drechslerella stenobrocha 248]|uniref:Cytochrome b561 domain-containing protein n=1 Tax=Drechslerella stenobrocha 248 TaxID=1043628 RepID=W7IHY2_9PEZI|nr:hypothetical protein DRE_00210 [Drechslerella stenobrocha 248]